MLLSKCVNKINKVNITWIYDIDDEDSIEAGKDIETALNLKFNYIANNGGMV